jgi:AcrR family transcriptional regulator
MPRPSRNTDKLLIEAGKKEIAEKGFSGLTLRQVAKRAGVNLGMFSYNFKSKGDFTAQVAQSLYEEFFKDLKIEIDESDHPLERLRSALLFVGNFIAANQRLILGFVKDLLAGDREMRGFIIRNFPRHVLLMAGLVRKCQKQGYLIKMPVAQTLIMLFAGVAAPVVAGAVLKRELEGRSVLKAVARLAGEITVFKGQVDQRVGLVLKAFATRKALADKRTGPWLMREP